MFGAMETYRISSSYPRRQAIALIAIFIFRLWGVPSATKIPIGVTIVAVLIAVIYFGRTCKQIAAHAETHSLKLTLEALVSQDGPSERRVPFETIGRIKIRRFLLGKR
jgi:hypothetical protein